MRWLLMTVFLQPLAEAVGKQLADDPARATKLAALKTALGNPAETFLPPGIRNVLKPCSGSD